MGNSITALNAYVPATTYVAHGYTAAVVYQKNSDGSYTAYANTIADVALPAAMSALTQNGFWFGTIGLTPLKLFTGNYMNYQGCTTCSSSQTKISIAKRVISNLLGGVTDSKFGVMKFTTNGGLLVSPIGTSTTTMATAVNAISPSGMTPLGEQLRDGGKYYAGTLAGATLGTTPIQSQCQSNSVFIISDGMWNGTLDPRTQAITEYTTDHSTHTGIQNLTINTIGFSVDAAESVQALAALQTIASNGGGSFTVANDVPALEQALFAIPPAISLTAPTQGNILSGTVQISAYAQNNACLTGVKFQVDGVDVGAMDTTSPYATTWDTNLVLNGTHTITAVSYDASGNTSVSFPIGVGTINDQTPPTINNVTVDYGFTTATVTWQTTEAADTQVRYGLTVTYDRATQLKDTNPRVLQHIAVMTGLTPDTQYFFQAVSHDALGNTVSYTGNFTTPAIAVVGTLDHLKLTFLNGGVSQPGPGFKTGSSPYIVNAGECYAATIEAMNNLNQHYSYDGIINLAQYSLDANGAITTLVPGISTTAYQLGVSSMDFTMVNGYVFLGSESDTNKRLCFYRASREPAVFRSGYPGDLRLQAIIKADPGISGISDYISWRGQPNRLAIAAPGQQLSPATPTGVNGALGDQAQGVPFTLTAHLTDRYWNPVTGGTDSVGFSASSPTYTSFNPFIGNLVNGALASSVTVKACAGVVSFGADDLSSSLITSTAVPIRIASCGVARFFDLVAPSSTTADQVFAVGIVVMNPNTPSGAGDTIFSGRLTPLVQTDSVHFSTALGTFAFPIFSFTMPENTHSTFTYTIPNQAYRKAQTIWLRLSGDNPEDLNGATALAGPITIYPGAAQTLTFTTDPETIAAETNANVIVTLTDAYGNGIPYVDITLNLTAGSGGLGADGNLLTQTLVTNSAGQSIFDFLSGPISETNTFLAYPPTLPGIPSINGTILVSLLGDKQIAAYPSPVKITERPLTIEYRLYRDSDVTVTITDLMGHEVWKRSYPPGTNGGRNGFNVVQWNGRNGAGVMSAVGVYGLHVLMESAGQTKNIKTRFGLKK